MKKFLSLLAVVSIFAAVSVRAQTPGASPADSSQLSSALAKIFGTNLNFSATMNVEIKLSAQNQTISTPGKVYFSDGNSRSEIDVTKITGGGIPPSAIAQMKSLGMDSMISIQQHAAKITYLIYPGLKAYAKIQTSAADSSTNNVKIDIADLGAETVDGHPCDKKQYTIIDANNGLHTLVTAWLATDLKNIPIQSEQTIIDENGSTNLTTVHFTYISPTKPDASLFTLPTGYTAYTDVQTMMQTEVMKKMTGQFGAPPH